MFKQHITGYRLYRWRYWIGYGSIAIILISALIFAGLYLPGGISSAEMQSVIKSNAIGLTNTKLLDVINLPYHLLQQACLAIFGVSIISIKLPSIILAFSFAACLVLLLRRWFKPSVGVLASLIAITTGQFLFIAQDGTPNILYLFYPICLMLLANLLSSQKRFRKTLIIASFIIVALSLYTPLCVYMIIALGIAVLLHPHLRYLIRQLPKITVIVGSIIALIIAMPLVINLIQTPVLSLKLLGIATKWPNLTNNIMAVGSQYFDFINPGGSTIMTPFFELGSMLIIAIGIYSLARNRSTSKTYIIAIWMLFIVPILIINPENNISSLFVPLILILAAGLNALLSSWYNLFPRNPYARIGGLIPLVILVSALTFSGVDRYTYGYRYDPNIVPNFSQDLKLIPKDTKNIVVSDDELAFYEVLAKHSKQITVSTMPISDTFLASHKAKPEYIGYKIDKIITTANRNDSDRFYLYKKLTD